ncbi:hypothetical protein ABPG74_015168 [Tetrahymena malaccensis]
MDERQSSFFQIYKNQIKKLQNYLKAIPDQDYLPMLSPQNQNYLAQDQFNSYSRDDIQVLKSRGLHISGIQDIQGGTNFESLLDQDLNDQQFSNLVMVLDKQQLNKEKLNRNIDLNKINYLYHINNKNDIYINSAKYNSFLQSVDFRPNIMSNMQRKESLQSTKIKKIYNTEANNNRLKNVQLQKIRNQDQSQKQKQQIQQDFRLKSSSEIKPSRVFIQNRERMNTYSTNEQQGKQESSIQNHQGSQNSTQISATINKSSSKKNKIPNLNFNSTYYFSGNSNFNSSNNKKQNKYIKDCLSTPRNKTNSYFFKREETGTEDEDLQNSKTQRTDVDFQIYNSTDGIQELKNRVKSTKSSINFLNSPKNNSLFFSNNKNTEQFKQKQLKTFISNIIPQTSFFQSAIKSPQSSNKSTARNIVNSLNAQSSLNSKIKLLNLKNLQTESSQQKYFTERISINNNSQDSKIANKNTSQQDDQIRQKLIKETFKSQQNQQYSPKNKILKNKYQNTEQIEQRSNINQNNSDICFFSPKNQLENEKILDLNIKQTRSQKKQQLIQLQQAQTAQNNLFFQVEENKQNSQILQLTPQQDVGNFIKNNQELPSIDISDFSQQNKINLNDIEKNNSDQFKLSNSHENNDNSDNCYTNDQKVNKNTDDDLNNQLIKTRNSKKSSLIDPSQLILLKKIIEKKQNANLEKQNCQKSTNLDDKQNEVTIQNLQGEFNSPKSNKNQNDITQNSPTFKSDSYKRKSCINVDNDYNTRYMEYQNEDSEQLKALGLDYFGIKQLSYYCDFQKIISKKQNPKIHQILNSNTFINSYKKIDLNQQDFSYQQLNSEHLKRGEEQKKKINILEFKNCSDLEDMITKNSLILKKNKNTLDRKMQQYIKRTFLEFEKQDNLQDKLSQEVIQKQSQETIDNKNLQNNQLDLQKLNIQNTLQRHSTQQNSPNRSSKTQQQQNSVIQLTVSINPPLNNQDSPSQASNQQIYKFVTFKNEKVSSTSIYSETSQQSYISSGTNEDSDNQNFNDANNQQAGEESDKDDEISLQLQEENHDNEFDILQNGNYTKSYDLNQQNQKLTKMKDPKNSFTATRNYLMNYLQKQNSQQYMKKMLKINQGIQNIQDKQKIQQKVNDQNSIDQSPQALENRQKINRSIGPSKSLSKLALDKKQVTKDFLEHQYNIDSYRQNPFYSSEEIQSPKYNQQENSGSEFTEMVKHQQIKGKASKNQKSVQKQTLENFSIEEIESCSSSSSQNSQSNSSESSNSSIDEDSLGNTQSQLGMDQYLQIQDQANSQQLQFVNDLEIYEDENYDPFTLSNNFIKSLQPQSLKESSSLLVRLYEHIPPIVSELQETQVEQVLNIKFQDQDQEIIELMMKKNNIGDKFQQISEKLEQDEGRYFKQYYSNYYTEQKDLLYGNFEDLNTINSNFYYLFSQNNQQNKTKKQTSNNKIESNYLKVQHNIANNHKKQIKQQKVFKEQPEFNDSKEQKEENQNVFKLSDSIKNYQLEAEFEPDATILTKKALEKKINLSQSLKESISLTNENTLQIQRSKFSNIPNKNQKETTSEDQNKKKSLTTAQQTPLIQPTKIKQQSQSTQEQNQELTMIFQTPPLNSVQANNNISQLQNSVKNINKIKGSQNLSKIDNKNYIQLNYNVSQSMLKPDILDKQSLSISNRNQQITKRKLLAPEQQIMMAIKHNQLTEFEDIFSKFHQIQINYSDEEGNNFLIVASSVGNIDIVRELIYKGININHQNDLGNTALHMALAYGNSEVADFLLQFKIDQNLVNVNNQTAWDTAIFN